MSDQGREKNLFEKLPEDAQIAPFAPAVAHLDEIPGVGVTAAEGIIAEIGVDMTRFPTPAHLASWPRFTPGSKSPPAARRASDLPVTATGTWPGSWARPPSLEPSPGSTSLRRDAVVCPLTVHFRVSKI